MRPFHLSGLAFMLALPAWAQEHGHSSPKADPKAKAPVAAPAASDAPDSPSAALSELQTGNARFVAGKRTRSVDTAKDAARRTELAKGQAPFAVIVTCSDSRVPDNFIFDQEAGRLFTIRVAGELLEPGGIASVDYAVEHLGSKVVIVMGHASCGAVKAVRDANGKPLPGNLWAFQAGMAGLLESTPLDPNEEGGAYLARLVEQNAKRQAQALVDRSAEVRHLAAEDKIWVVPAVYDLASGKVTFYKPLNPPAGNHS
ncbi:MAG TPA: carbonic anhydrase [Holophagaceae bacterium]|nr:carbonic anhydrase [Holophagaceae bacterium]